MSWIDSSPGMMAGRTPVNGHDPEEEAEKYPLPQNKRKNVVVVGLGMVGIAFMWVIHGCCQSRGTSAHGIANVEKNSRNWMPNDANTTS